MDGCAPRQTLGGWWSNHARQPDPFVSQAPPAGARRRLDSTDGSESRSGRDPALTAPATARVAGAVVAVLDDPVAIPRGQVGLVGTEDDLDSARESVLLGFDHVADDLVDTPFVWGGPPRRKLRGDGVEGGSERVARGLEQLRDLAWGQRVAGTTRVTGFSIRRLTSAMNCAAVAP